jgi:hypothetical protein
MEEDSVFSQIKQKFLELKLSQSSIESSSFFILEQCSQNRLLIPQVINLWDELCESNDTKVNHLGILYLANDLLLRRYFESEFPFQIQLFQEKILKNVPKICSKLNPKYNKSVMELVQVWKDSGLFEPSFYYSLQSSLRVYNKIKETTIEDLIKSECEVNISYKIINLTEQSNNFIKKRENSSKIKKEFKEGRECKERYINALKEENQSRKLVINLFSRDILLSKLVVHERHVKILGEIETLISRLNGYK